MLSRKIYTYREEDLSPEERTSYSRVTVGELRRAGFDIRNYEDTDIVYLDSENYKIYMSAQYYSHDNGADEENYR